MGRKRSCSALTLYKYIICLSGGGFIPLSVEEVYVEMAIGSGTLLEIVLKQSFLGGDAVYNTWTYECVGSIGAAPASAWAEAWWNHVKAAYRAICPTIASPFRAVTAREMDSPTGDYGEYSIPSSEWQGTRSPAGAEWLPSFNAVGVRLTVGTRVTRPGQKRFAYLMEGDSDGTYAQPSIITPINTLMSLMTGLLILGGPVGVGDLDPVVVRRDPTTGLPTANQPITGFVVDPTITTQVSRRVGRGI